MTLRALALLLVAASSLASQQSQRPQVPPVVGAVAKPLGQVNWHYAGAEGRIPPLVELRGQVVLIHTWGYYCPPCVSKSVPYVADLMGLYRDQGLRAYSISVPIEDGKPATHAVEVGRGMGLNHPIGVADGFGGMTPYLNMNVNRGLTWCFVIGREGGVRWAGDPSRDDGEFLEAVRAALLEQAMPPLPEDLPEALRDPVKLYVEGQLGRARDAADKVRARSERKRADEEAARVVSAAAQLVEQIDRHREELLARLDAAFESRDAPGYLAARRQLTARFQRTEAAKRVALLDSRLKELPELQREIERWEEWEDLRRSAPVLFPARADREGTRYAQRLQRYVEDAQPGAPGLEEARELLESFTPG